jgi:Common central domain of tyrosinase
MGIRKNAKFLSPPEQEAFVRACVMMKADIVNPAAAAADRYSRWDELVALHRMIQNANAPAASNVNFGHGGSGAYSFLSWHRYFLHRVELALQSYVPGVMLPYWDWTDPAPIMTDAFLGPNGASGTTIVGSGYFAADAPGTGTNPTPAPVWWPSTLSGWRLHTAFGVLAGPLERALGPVGNLPSVADIKYAMQRPGYPAFQNCLESGFGLVSGNQLHNGLHGWVGGHMSTLTASPFDPLFYLHHCNIDRLWAMWQMDGHASDYPTAGGNAQHHSTDIMYPWTGGAAGYSTNFAFPPIVMPSFAPLGAQHNGDTLDHRAYGYSYDTIAVIGIGVDRTGSMLGLTPDPMTVSAPDVTKWEAVKRGVSAFLQDAETVQDSRAIYVMAGIETFRSLVANEFTPVFSGTPYGLVKPGGAYSRAVFDSVVAGMAPGGGTPLVDALQHVEDTLVAPPFGWIPADEQRYLALLTDGLRTTGATMASIPDGSFTSTAIFAMGFGTGADVDYATIAGLVAKGRTLGSQQVFHGDNAGAIDKFYSNALAHAIGFVPLFDPVLELFAGEHVHLDIDVTSAEEALMFAVQGMDFEDDNWSFHLVAPDGVHAHPDDGDHGHAGGHAMRRPHVTAQQHRGRLSLVLQRDSADASAWVGRWRLMVSYRARTMEHMVMVDLGELMFPVAAGPVRGPRFARLLAKPEARIAARSVIAKSRHALDVRPGGTNRDRQQACSVVINVYARSRLRVELVSSRSVGDDGRTALSVSVVPELLAGSIVPTRAFARMVAPKHDLRRVVTSLAGKRLPRGVALAGSLSRSFDAARALALLEREDGRLAEIRDEVLAVVTHDHGPMHVHSPGASIAGVHHFGVYVQGSYCPAHGVAAVDHAHEHGATPSAAPQVQAPDSECGPDCRPERFSRLLTTSIAVNGDAAPARPARPKSAVGRRAAKPVAKPRAKPRKRR